MEDRMLRHPSLGFIEGVLISLHDNSTLIRLLNMKDSQKLHFRKKPHAKESRS